MGLAEFGRRVRFRSNFFMNAGSSLVPQCKVICNGNRSSLSYGYKVHGHINVYGSFCTAIGALCICMHILNGVFY
jgi:hypothetical protein